MAVSISSFIRIRGGHVIDPGAQFSGVRDVWIENGRISDGASVPEGNHAEVDASGCFVFPGLVDFHVHIFEGGTEIGLPPDAILLPLGITTAVDQGSAGVASQKVFRSGILDRTALRSFAFLNCCPAGLATARYLENVNPSVFDPQAIRDVFDRHGDIFRGLKIRQSIEIAGDLGLKPLERCIQIADDLGVPVVVHTTDSAGDIEDLANMLRSGDVFSHVFHGRGQTILDGNGVIRPAVLRARERGVLFDSADGRLHYGLRVIRRALEQGFMPDTISTDLTRVSMLVPPVFGLPFVMSKYLALGMRLEDVVRAVTQTPVRALNLDRDAPESLSPGACADVAVFKLKDVSRTITDQAGETLEIPRLLVPQMTYREGRALYRNMEF